MTHLALAARGSAGRHGEVYGFARVCGGLKSIWRESMWWVWTSARPLLKKSMEPASVKAREEDQGSAEG